MAMAPSVGAGPTGSVPQGGALAMQQSNTESGAIDTLPQGQGQQSHNMGPV